MCVCVTEKERECVCVCVCGGINVDRACVVVQGGYT